MTGRIEDYAIVGDMQSAALICTDGSVDWLCLPRFDSEACFAALLGTPDHGRWRIAPADGPDGGAEGSAAATRRRYDGDTLILETRWETPDGAVRVTELSGHRDEAVELFERLLALRNDVGLLSEEYDPRYGRLVGNMPQAFSHVPLVQTALNLSSHADEHQRGTGIHRDERRSVPG